MSPLAAVVLTALLAGVASAAITLGVAYRLFTRRWKRRIEAEVDRHLDAALARLGDEVERRVAEGVRRGVESLTSTESLRTTARNVTRGGAGLLEELLLGPKKPREPREP